MVDLGPLSTPKPYATNYRLIGLVLPGVLLNGQTHTQGTSRPWVVQVKLALVLYRWYQSSRCVTITNSFVRENKRPAAVVSCCFEYSLGSNSFWSIINKLCRGYRAVHEGTVPIDEQDVCWIIYAIRFHLEWMILSWLFSTNICTGDKVQYDLLIPHFIYDNEEIIFIKKHIPYPGCCCCSNWHPPVSALVFPALLEKGGWLRIIPFVCERSFFLNSLVFVSVWCPCVRCKRDTLANYVWPI